MTNKNIFILAGVAVGIVALLWYMNNQSNQQKLFDSLSGRPVGDTTVGTVIGVDSPSLIFGGPDNGVCLDGFAGGCLPTDTYKNRTLTPLQALPSPNG